MAPHLPVLATEVLALFQDLRLKTFVDGTVGAGGHAALMLEAHPEIERFYAIDQDLTALALAKEHLASFTDKVTYIHSPFGNLADHVHGVDGVLLDIGVSSMQLDQAERGFSFYREGPLDMRMNQESDLTAEIVVNRYSEKQLSDLFFEFGEERRSRQAAKAICEARRHRPIKTTDQLVKVLEPVLGWSTRHHHPATRIFQAIRIEVNHELDQLKEGIAGAISVLNPGGRVAIITFHSLEDRIVKHQFKDEKEMNILTKKPITATKQEQRVNKRSRSAKLRCIERCHPDS